MRLAFGSLGDVESPEFRAVVGSIVSKVGAADAALLARAVGRPVRVQLTREQEDCAIVIFPFRKNSPPRRKTFHDTIRNNLFQ